MKSKTTLTALIKEPDAFRGLDHLIESARRVLDRYMRTPVRMPERNSEQKPLARTA